MRAPSVLSAFTWLVGGILIGGIALQNWSFAADMGNWMEAWLAPRRALNDVTAENQHRAAAQIRAYQEGAVVVDTPLFDQRGKKQQVLQAGAAVLIYSDHPIPAELKAATDGRAFYYVRLPNEFGLPQEREEAAGYVQSTAVKNKGTAPLPGIGALGEGEDSRKPGTPGHFLMVLAPGEMSRLFEGWPHPDHRVTITPLDDHPFWVHVKGRPSYQRTRADDFQSLPINATFWLQGGAKGNRFTVTIQNPGG